MKTPAFDEAFARWVATRPEIKAVVLIGSHVRAAQAVNAADAQSDWDYQIVTSAPAQFARREWVAALGCGEPIAYAYRPTFGGVKKVTFLLPGMIEVDLVVLAAAPLQAARLVVALGLHRRPGGARQALGNLAIVIRPGYRFVKGERRFGRLFARVVAEVPDPRLDDQTVAELAEGVACDVVWARRKLARGEFLAVQRLLHLSLAETNFRLLHELRLRRGELSFPEARRIELAVPTDDRAAVQVSAHASDEELGSAVEKAWTATRRLTVALVPGWTAPAID